MDEGGRRDGAAQQPPRSAGGPADAGGPVSEELRPLGQRLLSARQALGLSLEDVEDRTHIRRSYLEALEGGRAEVLPAEVFVKGFLRSYGDHLGLDGAGLVEEYKLAVRRRQAREAAAAAGRGLGRPAPGDDAEERRSAAPLRNRSALRRSRARSRARPEARPGRRERRRVWAWLLVAAALAVLLYVGVRSAEQGPRPVPPATTPGRSAARPAGSGASAASSATAPPASSVTAPPASAAAPPSSTAAQPAQVVAQEAHSAAGWQATYTVSGATGLLVTLSASAYCWTERWADGSTAGTQYRLAFTQPETVSWAAQQSLTIELGNSEVITALSVDGIALGRLPVQAPDPAEHLTFQLR